jgi:predicted ATPase
VAAQPGAFPGRGEPPAPPPLFLAERAAPPPPTVFVGRERELAALTSDLQKARTGAGQFRFVVGEAGQGNTMLVQEFARQAQLDDPGLLTVFGYGHAHTGLGDPYHPFREALALLCGNVRDVWEGGPIDSRQARRLWEAAPQTIPALVAQAPHLVGSFVPGQALLDRATAIAPQEAIWLEQLTRLVTGESEPKLCQKDVFGQTTAFLKTIAGQQSLLLILEDLHWADPASCGLLFHLSRNLSNSPILLVGTYRPEEITLRRDGGRHPLAGVVDELKRQHGDIWLDLGEMAEDEGRQFVAAYLDSQTNRLDQTFREALFRQTGGYPLFTAELVHDMQARGDLRQDEAGYWVAGEAIDWQTLPTRVEGVIETRLHRLDEAQQAMLATACVEGERFTAGVVARVHGLDERAVVRQLSGELDKGQRLVSAQALERIGDERLARYRFRHHLIQHYLYHNLDEPERACLHEAVGAALEAIYGEQKQQAAVQLARHFQQAGVAA